jgi:hypothetical protein
MASVAVASQQRALSWLPQTELNVFTQTKSTKSYIQSSCDHLIAIYRSKWNVAKKLTYSLKYPNRQPYPDTKFTPALKYNQLKVFRNTKSVST